MYLALGISLGVLIGAILDNISMGICIGIICGAVLDGIKTVRNNKKTIYSFCNMMNISFFY